MIDLLITLSRNAKLHTARLNTDDLVLVIGTNHKDWFWTHMLPILEFERMHKSKNTAPTHIEGVDILWTEEHPNLFLFIERKYLNTEPK